MSAPGPSVASGYVGGALSAKIAPFFYCDGIMLKPILLVEDNPRDLELTLIALEKSQLANEVIVLRDGAEALDYLLRRGAYADRVEGNPAVILLDLKLPKVDGLEVLEAVRTTEALRSIPVVMLTSSTVNADLSRAYELGANAYVVKPVEFKAFVAAVSDLGMFWAVLNEPPPGSVRPTTYRREPTADRGHKTPAHRSSNSAPSAARDESAHREHASKDER